MENIKTTLFNTVKQVLDEKKYTYKSDENDTFLTYKIRYNNLIDYVVTYMIDTYDDGIRIIAEFPIGPAVDDDVTVGKVYEYLCRANSVLYHGFIEMNSQNGTIRIKDFFKCCDKPFDANTIKGSLDGLSHMQAQHFIGIFNLLVNNAPPEEAVKMGTDPHHFDAPDPEDIETIDIDTDIFGDADDQ